MGVLPVGATDGAGPAGATVADDRELCETVSDAAVLPRAGFKPGPGWSVGSVFWFAPVAQPERTRDTTTKTNFMKER